ncbi:polymer-forming cytoskeletal protein [Ottowia sp. GY511]|uniref:Polymer-forming cytoskeletal protein n=1 Tax=Ottowia flava TaxID=2675430 RepID=A0ABW4KQQ9_9BURK|nr:polymer-forming cytoskeletal protein [Ottowia sp. GY511]TXK32924.1 polymer-forming cytoskeletal protein [Ottowia sp. GY511]
MLGIKKPWSVRSTIAAGMKVAGDCTFQEGLQIDGTVLGDVTAEGAGPSVLVIGEGGSVQGAISADHVVIGGTVVGPVLARELLELQSKARIQGDVRYKALEMQQGAVIAGQLQPQVTPPSPVAAPAAPAEARSALPAEPTEPTLDLDRP